MWLKYTDGVTWFSLAAFSQIFINLFFLINQYFQYINCQQLFSMCFIVIGIALYTDCYGLYQNNVYPIWSIVRMASCHLLF